MEEHVSRWVLGQALNRTSRQGLIAEELGIDGTSLVRVIDALVAEKLLVRRDDPADRRANLLSLTLKGKLRARELDMRFHAVCEHLLGDLDAAQIDSTVKILDLIDSILLKQPRAVIFIKDITLDGIWFSAKAFAGAVLALWCAFYLDLPQTILGNDDCVHRVGAARGSRDVEGAVSHYGHADRRQCHRGHGSELGRCAPPVVSGLVLLGRALLGAQPAQSHAEQLRIHVGRIHRCHHRLPGGVYAGKRI